MIFFSPSFFDRNNVTLYLFTVAWHRRQRFIGTYFTLERSEFALCGARERGGNLLSFILDLFHVDRVYFFE